MDSQTWSPLRRAALAFVTALCAMAVIAGSASADVPVNNLTQSANPVTGYADLHAHQFANLGFGGLLVWGEPFNENGISWALPWSDFMPSDEGEVVNGAGAPVGRVPCGPLTLTGCPPQCPPDTRPAPSLDPACMGVMIHGPGGAGDLLNLALSGSVGHLVGGYPQFDGWPRWNNYTGQQMYVDWLERSWRGGQRLMVMLAVNNETLCHVVNRRASFGCGDMSAVDRQIQAAKDLEVFVDNRDDGFRNNSGWYRIAYSSADARSFISSGKLAVVLGTEVPSLFGCTKNNSACDASYIRTQLDHYYDLGVRHIFPIHNADNRFGGTALYNDLFAFNNKAITGDWWNVENCSNPDITFHVGSMSNPLITAVAGLVGQSMPPVPDGSNCNARGLTPEGEVLLDRMMQKHMIIDLDHMSTRMINSSLDRLEAAHYPAVAMSHSGFIGEAQPGGEAAHEGNKDAAQLERIRNLGGTVATIFHQGGRSDVKTFTRDGNAPVPFDCGGSSQAFAQMYLYAVQQMQGRAVAFGSDFNGLAGMPAPRFGSEACHGDHPSGYSPTNRVTYPFTAPSGVELTKQVVGDKTFDYNEDGLSNVGQIPDFIQDLKQIGVSNADLAPLMNSAEQYVRMWELAEDTTPPSIHCDSADGNWHGGNVALSCTASDAVAGLSSPADASFTLSTSVSDGSETDNASTGSREVCDSRDNCATAGPIGGNKVDKKDPTITITRPQATTYTVGEPLTASYSCQDGGSGVQTCAGPVADTAAISTNDVGTHTFTVYASDNVGNDDVKGVDYVVSFGVCPLYDVAKPKPAGSVVPLKMQLCNNSGGNLSSPSLTVTGLGLTFVSTNVDGTVDDAGSANPDSDFRYDPSLGGSGGYIYNASTKGKARGTWAMRFRATGDPNIHKLQFELK